MRSVHDVGGQDFGAVPLEDHDMATWEKRSNAVANALRQKHLATLDEQRRHVESLGDGMRYMVLPMRPGGTETFSEAELAELVNRDCLVGTRLPDPPRRLPKGDPS